MGDAVPDRGPLLLGTSLGFGIPAVLIVVWRITYRIYARAFNSSDGCISIAAMVLIAHISIDTNAVVHWGYGKHEMDLPPSIRQHHGAALDFWLTQVLTKPICLFSKLSVCLIYLKMFDGTSGKRAAIARVGNWVTMTIVIGYYFASFFVTIFQCTPVEKSWKPRLQGHCINMKAFFYTTGGVNVLTSALIITLPLFVLLQTTQRRSEVSQLLGLIMLGVVDTITSIGRLFTLTSASALNSDRTWTLINSTTASAIELSIMVMAASLVSMRPHIYVLYCALFPRAARRDGGHHHPSAAAATRDGYALHTGSYGHSATDHCSTGEGAATKPPRGIVKTTQIELSSLSVSTENILRNDDRF